MLPLRFSDLMSRIGFQVISKTLSKSFINFICRLLSNFSVTFSIISVITGITTLYSTGLAFGGPVSMVYGWLIAGLFTMLVGLSMSEICSAYPTAGGLYFWSAKLCGNDWGPFASWLTGWLVLFITAINISHFSVVYLFIPPSY